MFEFNDTIPVTERTTAAQRQGATVTAQEVNAESFRRLDAAYPPQVRDYLIVQGEYLLFKRVEGGTWNAADNTLVNQVKALRAKMVAIKDAADALKAMNPIPLDYQSNSYWPA